MQKLSSAMIATTLIASASFNLEDYVKNDLLKNQPVKVKGVELIEKKDLPNYKNWTAYMFLMDLIVRGKEDKFPETIFVNEEKGLVALDLYDYKKHKLLKSLLHPKMDASYYDKSHLMAGKEDAKHKIVIFSDPQCPFCQMYVPPIYQAVKKNPDTFALYYYHMPLRIHPVSDTLTRVMEVLQKQGKMDDAMKMYELKINIRETNETKILEAIKKQFNLDIKKEEIDKEEIKKAVASDKDKGNHMMLRGTPTIYIDGEFQNDPKSYQKYLKK